MRNGPHNRDTLRVHQARNAYLYYRSYTKRRPKDTTCATEYSAHVCQKLGNGIEAAAALFNNQRDNCTSFEARNPNLFIEHHIVLWDHLRQKKTQTGRNLLKKAFGNEPSLNA